MDNTFENLIRSIGRRMREYDHQFRPNNFGGWDFIYNHNQLCIHRYNHPKPYCLILLYSGYFDDYGQPHRNYPAINPPKEIRYVWLNQTDNWKIQNEDGTVASEITINKQIADYWVEQFVMLSPRDRVN